MSIAFVPIRKGSKGIPGKNMKVFCGKPLLFWVLDALIKSKIDLIVVATDDGNASVEIERHCKQLQMDKTEKVPVELYPRRLSNAGDKSSTESVMLEYIENRRRHMDDGDIFMLVQATSPFLESHHVNEALEKMESHECDSLLTVVPFDRFLWERGEPFLHCNTEVNYSVFDRPLRQVLKENYFMENGAIYASRVRQILDTKSRLSGAIGRVVMPKDTFVEIDDHLDWALSETIAGLRGVAKDFTSKIKLLVMDLDGTLTDGKLGYTETGELMKLFNTHDAMGFFLIKYQTDVEMMIITGAESPINRLRMGKLDIPLYERVDNKLASIQEYCSNHSISLSEVAFIGDDVNDLDAMRNVGFAACPSSAVDAVRFTSGVTVLKKAGGEGCVREFIDLFILGR